MTRGSRKPERAGAVRPVLEHITLAELDPYLSLRVLATYSGLSRRTIKRHLASAEHSLPHYRVGRRVLVRRSEFDEWMQEWRRAESEAERLVRRALNLEPRSHRTR
jgi:excisionase family DNA binding protein